MLRWVWRQLTSMRTALQLLLLLAVAAVPGSLFPQRRANPAVVTQYLKDNPDTGPWLDRLQMFDVFSSVWFSAIYLLLFTSLVGCVLPRTKAHLKALRSAPPRTPRRFARLPQHGSIVLNDGGAGMPAPDPAAAVKDAAAILRKLRYRVDIRDADTATPSVGAERGFMKEAGNLLFHTALIGVLVSVAIGGMFGYRGQKLIVEGEGFTNALIGYDSFSPGTNFNPDTLTPFALTLDDFDVRFNRDEQSTYGQPLDFTARMTVQESPDQRAEDRVLKVNSPIGIGGTNVYLVGNGYAPVVEVRDGEGNIAFSGPVPSQPTDSAYTSTIVIKAPDANPDQLGFVGFFLPTAVVNSEGLAFGSDPDPFNPRLNLNSYYGDLGLDDGTPRSVYQLDTTNLTQLNGRDLNAGGIVLEPGQTYELPDGRGSITFDSLKRFVALDITYDPGKIGALIFSTLALTGLILSLITARRRVWIKARATPEGGTTLEYGLLARGEDSGLRNEAIKLEQALSSHWGVTPSKNEQKKPEPSPDTPQQM
ncbi:cytochrome c biogenesis protein ResB (plasmid) [Arthrobacter agilis]|uniref:cytochrome c biogenesis protein ResB n=1 Tax=Arthrobacter TaxID=1663 RepID=UPI000CE371BB|nr:MULTISPECIES: cytochrome c biogenesis protein ResB [Arthrobacter]WDF35146.1 cytochrome c biogenesis protein ResB [Arthrobacter agilis]